MLRQFFKAILFLQDSSAPHKAAVMHKKLVDLYLSHSDYYLFPNLKKCLKGRKKVFEH
jgi:hypothetical protein